MAQNEPEKMNSREPCVSRESLEDFLVYKDMYINAPMAYFSVDRNGLIVRCNKAAVKLLGYEENELIAKPVFGIYADTPFGKEKAKKVFVRFIEGESINDEELQIRTKDGRAIWISLTVTTVKDENGQIIKSRSAVIDISKRKEIEKKAAKFQDEAEKSLRLNSAIMENVAEGIYLIGLDDGIIKYANPRFEDMFGYDSGEMIGKNVVIVNAPAEKSPEETKNEIMEILRKTGEWHGEVKNIKKDGAHFWCYANVSLFDHPDYGKVLVSVHTDITERKQAEEKIKIFSDAVENAYEAIVLSDINLNINYANKSALSMLGYNQEEIIKLKIKDIDSNPDSLMNIDAEMEKQDRWSGERLIIGKSGKETPVMLSVAFIKDKDGRPFGIMGSFIDMTAEKQTRAALEKRLRELELFHKAATYREERILELKKKIEELEGKTGEA